MRSFGMLSFDFEMLHFIITKLLHKHLKFTLDSGGVISARVLILIPGLLLAVAQMSSIYFPVSRIHPHLTWQKTLPWTSCYTETQQLYNLGPPRSFVQPINTKMDVWA